MKQQYLFRNTNIRTNAINAINQLQLDEKRPVVIEIKEMTRSIDQVARCGNAVPPPFAEALVRANLPGLCQHKEIAA
nr:recombination protein NinB [Citrobacter sp. Awk 4]